MNNVVGLIKGRSDNALAGQRGLLEKESLSLLKSINDNVFLIESLENNIVNLKKGKTIVSLNEYRKILQELAYLNNNLFALKGVYSKYESQIKSIQKVVQKEGKLLQLPLKKAKKRGRPPKNPK